MLRTLALLLALVACATGQTLKILSERYNSFVLNGVFQQNHTITVQCTDADFGITRYLTVTRADGTSNTIGVRCNAPTYTYTTTLVGYVPADGISLLFSNCLVQNPYGYDPNLLAQIDLDRAPSNPGQLVAQSIHRRKLVHEVRPDSLARPFQQRKFFGALIGGIVGGIIACAIPLGLCGGGGGADPAKLAELNTRVDALQGQTNNLIAATDKMAGQITNLFTAQSEFATTVSASLTTTTQLFNQQLDLANKSLQAQKNTTDYLSFLNGGLTQDFGNLRTQLLGTQTQVSSLETQVLAGFNVSAGNLAAVVRDLNYVSGNLTLQMNNSNIQSAKRLGYLRARVEKLTVTTQLQLMQINDLLRNTQARRALAQFTQAKIPDIINQGFTPFLGNLGTAPAADSSEFVWKMNIEVSRVLYIRNSGGLSAQQLDVAWYCNTQKLIEFGNSVSTYLDIFRQFGPSNCNNTIAGNCTCWAVSQRYSCATTSGAYNSSDWLNKTDLRNSSVCTSAVTTSAAVSHVTLDSLLVVLSAVCNDGTWNGLDLRVISGLLGRSASIPANSAVCTMVFDTLADVSATGINFMYAILFYLQLSFSKVYVASDSYAKYIYGTVPDGVSTVDDPLGVVNGTDVRCYYSTFMSYDAVHPMLPVYKMTFVSTSASVTMTLDNVTTNDITQVTQAVPDSFLLGPFDSQFVVNNPADTSVSYDVPFSAITLSPSSEGRCGGVDYALVDNPNNFTISKWNVANRGVFNHFCATNVPSYFKRTLNGQGLCTGTALAGEGTWCTVRQNFEITSTVDGFKLQPRTGTGATTIVEMVIPDGNITSLLFSECPSISLQQTAPNVATLTLGNPRPDGDITVAIVLGGQCAATVSSFTISKNTQRDYLIPVCSGKTSSSRTVSVFRYDSAQQLHLCGNTTNITVDRQTFISQFSTPDILQVNVTNQLSLDVNQLALQRAMNDIRDIVAQLAIASVKAQISTGVQLDALSYNNFKLVLDRLQDGSVITAALINSTRNTALFDYSGAFAQYSVDQYANIAEMNSTINGSKFILDVLSQQAYNASSLAAHIAELTNTTNIAVNEWRAAVAAYANATLAAIQANVAYLNSIHFSGPVGLGGLSDFFGGVGSFLLDDVLDPGIGLLKEGIGFVAKAVVGAANFAADLVKTGLNGLLGLTGDLFKIFFWVIVAVVAFLGIGAIGSLLLSPQVIAILTGKFSTSDLADVKQAEKDRKLQAAQQATQERAAAKNNNQPAVKPETPAEPTAPGPTQPTTGYNTNAYSRARVRQAMRYQPVARNEDD